MLHLFCALVGQVEKLVISQRIWSLTKDNKVAIFLELRAGSDQFP